MVVYEKGKPKRNDYRKFKIKSVQGPDDYASMEEVLTRRFRRGIEEQKDKEEEEFLSVSYTHLDVYKRQVYESCGSRYEPPGRRSETIP